jgi:hypothetical protein
MQVHGRAAARTSENDDTRAPAGVSPRMANAVAWATYKILLTDFGKRCIAVMGVVLLLSSVQYGPSPKRPTL